MKIVVLGEDAFRHSTNVSEALNANVLPPKNEIVGASDVWLGKWWGASTVSCKSHYLRLHWLFGGQLCTVVSGQYRYECTKLQLARENGLNVKCVCLEILSFDLFFAKAQNFQRQVIVIAAAKSYK